MFFSAMLRLQVVSSFLRERPLIFYQNITPDYSQLLDSSTNQIKASAVPEPTTVLASLLEACWV
ncbi:MAG: hypothetical protein ACYTXT_24085 [Nostoc sp.]